MPQAGDVQSYDRYAYANNDPTKYIDPTGHRNCEEDGYNCSSGNQLSPLSVAMPVNTTIGPENNSIHNYSYTGYITIGNGQISLENNTYDTTDQRYRLPGIPHPDDTFSTPLDLLRIGEDYAIPYANDALSKSTKPNVGITINYGVNFGNPSTFDIDSLQITNLSGFPLQVNTVFLTGNSKKVKPIGQTSSLPSTNYQIGISTDSYFYADASVYMYSSTDYEDSGFRFLNVRLWPSGSAQDLAR